MASSWVKARASIPLAILRDLGRQPTAGSFRCSLVGLALYGGEQRSFSECGRDNTRYWSFVRRVAASECNHRGRVAKPVRNHPTSSR